MSQEPDPLQRTDYVAYWAQEARAHAALIGWPADRIDSVVSALEAAFGADWLRTEAPKPSRSPITGDPKRHPVAEWIAGPYTASVMQLIELAVYLRSCSSLVGFASVLEILRVPQQFTTARMQLALAHRLVLAGAHEVELEPSADRGKKADLHFSYGGRRHLVECYEPVPDRNADHGDLLHDGANRVLDAAWKSNRLVVVRVDLRRDLQEFDGKMRKRVEQEARYLISRLSGPRTRQAKCLADFEIEVIEASGVAPEEVKELAFSLGKPGAWIVAPSLLRRDDVARIPRGESTSVLRKGWFVVNAMDRDNVDAMQSIATALEGKLGQVRRRADDVLGVMVAITNFARLASRFSVEAQPLVQALRSKVLGSHDSLAGAMLIQHGLHRERGPFIGGLFLEGRDGAHLLELHAAIASREETHRVLDDWV